MTRKPRDRPVASYSLDQIVMNWVNKKARGSGDTKSKIVEQCIAMEMMRESQNPEEILELSEKFGIEDLVG